MKTVSMLVFLNLALVAYAQMANHRIRDWLTAQIKRQTHSPLRFSGRHDEFDAQTLTTRETVDFNFHTECSEFVELKMFEIRSLDDADKIIMLTGVGDSTHEENLVQQAIDRLHSFANWDVRYPPSPLRNTLHSSDKIPASPLTTSSSIMMA